ncbi:hypothetical protein MMC16_003225 [Acarospora aff. strigata]|nr:hypothetical protein [Acarospora aff. strigata]
MRSILSPVLVLSIIPWFAFTAFTSTSSISSSNSAPSSSHTLFARGDLPVPPFPEGYSAADCSSKLLPGTSTSRRQKRNPAGGGFKDVCRSIRKFSFVGRPYRVSKTQSVSLVTGNTYVLSVAANELIEGVLAFAKGPTPKDAKLIQKFRPNRNVATLEFKLDAAAEVFFFIVSPSNNIAGEIALWALGSGPIPPNPGRPRIGAQ